MSEHTDSRPPRDDARPRLGVVRRRTVLIAGALATSSVIPWAVGKVLDAGSSSLDDLRAGTLNIVPVPAPVSPSPPFSASRPQYVLPFTQTELEIGGPLQEPDDVDTWALRLGGVKADALWIAYTVTVNEPTLLIQDISIEVVRRRPAVSGTWLAPNGAGDYFETFLSVGLDHDPPTVERTSSGSQPWDYPLSLGEPDTLVFAVGAGALDHDVEFTVVVSWTNPRTGESGSMTTDDDGRPYRLTGVANCDQYFRWDPSTGAATWGSMADFD